MEAKGFISLIRSGLKDSSLEIFSKSLRKKLSDHQAVEIFYEGFNQSHYVVFPSFKIKQAWVTAIRKVQRLHGIEKKKKKKRATKIHKRQLKA